MRPQHIRDALLIDPPLEDEEIAFLRNVTYSGQAYHVVSIRKTDRPLLSREIWFDRESLHIVRQAIYEADGEIATDAWYRQWLPTETIPFPGVIQIDRPKDGYMLRVEVLKAGVNEQVSTKAFVLNPAGGGQGRTNRGFLRRKESPSGWAMINRLVVSNLLHRPIRTGLSILAVAMEVTMMLLVVGLAEGLLEESHRRSRGIGADILIRPSASSAAMALGSADIPAKLAAFLPEKYDEIEMAMGTTLNMQGDLQTITGVEWDEFTRMSGGTYYFSGGPPDGPYDVIVDEVYARYKKVKVGDTLELLNKDFHVAGVVETGKMSRIFIPLETMAGSYGVGRPVQPALR